MSFAHRPIQSKLKGRFGTDGWLRIHYNFLNQQASDVPLVLVHGLGRSSYYWGEFASIVAEKTSVVCIDNRGVGKSSATLPPYSTDDMALDIAAVLDDAGIKQCFLMGVSLGGMICQAFALQFPSRVKKLILGCTSFGGVHRVGARPLSLVGMGASALLPPRLGEKLVTHLVVTSETRRANRQLASSWAEERRQHKPQWRGILGQALAGARHNTKKRLSEISMPTLVITGRKDRVFPTRSSELLAKQIPKSELKIIDNAGHGFFHDKPQEAAEVVLSFVGRPEGAKPAGGG